MKNNSVREAYKEYLKHLKTEHPQIYKANKEVLEEQYGRI